MTVNIYDNANEMAKVLKQTEQYLNWESAFDAIQKDDEAKKLFDQFQTVQMSVQQMMQSQQQPSEEQEKEWDTIASEVQKNTLITALLSTEQALNTVLTEINDIVTKPVSEAYSKIRQ
ncbi:YlbF family regulator [Leuconostoc palmae]|uniref:YlbF family regulator n=1 Tax=Leuconostoc palmae TaxID=501487 RepID=UPI001C7CD7A9|nr:YlbF family regulator [Leuconostoc palmae]